jgi:hypothetical protein
MIWAVTTGWMWARALGQLLADSGYFSDARGAAQAAVKVMAGAELGFPPIQSMMGVYIVKGKVTLSANLMAAAIKRHPAYTFRVKEHTNDRCVIDFIENGEVIGTSEFSMEDAQKANLTGLSYVAQVVPEEHAVRPCPEQRRQVVLPGRVRRPRSTRPTSWARWWMGRRASSATSRRNAR